MAHRPGGCPGPQENGCPVTAQPETHALRHEVHGDGAGAEFQDWASDVAGAAALFSEPPFTHL